LRRKIQKPGCITPATARLSHNCSANSFGLFECIVLFDLPIDIGAFSKYPDEMKPGEQAEIYLQKHLINQAETLITLTLDEKPSYVGIDPLNKLADRNSDDNVTKVE